MKIRIFLSVVIVGLTVAGFITGEIIFFIISILLSLLVVTLSRLNGLLEHIARSIVSMFFPFIVTLKRKKRRDEVVFFSMMTAIAFGLLASFCQNTPSYFNIASAVIAAISFIIFFIVISQKKRERNW